MKKTAEEVLIELVNKKGWPIEWLNRQPELKDFILQAMKKYHNQFKEK